MLKEFKKFLLRGNVVDLAVAVIIGAAFTAVIAAVVRDFITPLLSAIQGKQDLSKYIFNFHHIAFHYGDFLNVLLGFLITAAVVFFLVIQPINKVSAISTRRKGKSGPTTRDCPECLSEIPIAATRCKYCTSVVKPMSKPDKAKK